MNGNNKYISNKHTSSVNWKKKRREWNSKRYCLSAPANERDAAKEQRNEFLLASDIDKVGGYYARVLSPDLRTLLKIICVFYDELWTKLYAALLGIRLQTSRKLILTRYSTRQNNLPLCSLQFLVEVTGNELSADRRRCERCEQKNPARQERIRFLSGTPRHTLWRFIITKLRVLQLQDKSTSSIRSSCFLFHLCAPGMCGRRWLTFNVSVEHRLWNCMFVKRDAAKEWPNKIVLNPTIPHYPCPCPVVQLWQARCRRVIYIYMEWQIAATIALRAFAHRNLMRRRSE